jgi:hypothetical protein
LPVAAISVNRLGENQQSTFCPDPLTNMAPQAILVSDWLISKKSSPLLKER